MYRFGHSLLLIAILAPAALGQEEPPRAPAPGQPVVALSLEEAIARALKRNLDIEVQGYTPEIRQAQIETARGAFDPVYRANATGTRTIAPSTVEASGDTVLQTRQYDIGNQVSRRLPTGGTLTLRLAGRHQRSNATFESTAKPTLADNDVWQTTGTLSLTQPLLRNLGFHFNRSEIQVAENNLDSAYHTFNRQVQDTVQAVIRAYWSLYLASESLKIRLESLDRVRVSMELTKILVREGKLAQHEIYDVETNLASALEQVHTAQKSVLDNEDTLKRLISPEESTFLWNSHLELTSPPPLSLLARTPDESARTALELRPEIAIERVNLRNADEALLQARNQLLPSLNFTGSANIRDASNTTNNLGDSTDIAFSGNPQTGWGWDWTLGVEFEVPIGNRPARSAYTRRVIERRQAEATVRNVESQIVNDVREAARDVETTHRRVDVTGRGAESAKKRYDSEVILFREGQSDNFRLQQFRQNLLTAELQRIQAVSDHATSQVDLERAEGTILRRLRERNIIVRGMNE